MKFNKDFEPSDVTVFKEHGYVCSDEGGVIKFDLETFKKLGEYKFGKKDFEGMTHSENSIYLVEEGYDQIFKFENGVLSEKYVIGRRYRGETVFHPSGDGFESLAFYKEDKDFIWFYVANQSRKFEGEDKSAIALVKVYKKINIGFIEKYFPMKIKDISGMELKDNKLTIISDKENKMFLLDPDNMGILEEIRIPGKDL